MAVRVLKIHAASAAAMVDLHIVPRVRFASVWNSFRPNASEDRVELRLADLEGVVMDVEPFIVAIVVEIKSECVIHSQWRKVPDAPFIEPQSEYPREELRRLDFVPCRHNGVIEFDRHEKSCCLIPAIGRVHVEQKEVVDRLCLVLLSHDNR